MVCPYL